MTENILSGKIIVVVGGAGLIGSEFVEAILLSGGTPIIADIDSLKGKSLEKKLMDKYPDKRIVFKKILINSEKSVHSFIEYVSKKFGRIDAWINCAYPKPRNYGRKLFEIKYKDICQNFNLHLGGYFLGNQLPAEYFVNQKFGNIINVASVYGFLPPRFAIYDKTDITMPVDYAMVKAGIIQLSKYLAKYLKGKNVRVNCISPGGVFNNQPKEFVKNYNSLCLGKGMLSASDLSGTLIYLLSDLSASVNGQNLIIDDGFSL